MFSSKTANQNASKGPKTSLNLIDLFKPNKGCTDLMYTETGDISLNVPLQSEYDNDNQDINDLNRNMHSTVIGNESIIPQHTLLPSVTKLFQKNEMLNKINNRFNRDIDGDDIPHFRKPKATNPFEFCIVRGLLSMGMGYVGGCFFALFINAFQNPIPWELQDKLTTKEQLVYSYKDLARNMKRMGKQMALIGGLYGTIECIIERRRAKQDIDNHLMTGCLTGGILASPAGLWPAVMGCGGFAAFSFAIESYMMAAHEPECQDDENTRNYQMMFD